MHATLLVYYIILTLLFNNNKWDKFNLWRSLFYPQQSGSLLTRHRSYQLPITLGLPTLGTFDHVVSFLLALAGSTIIKVSPSSLAFSHRLPAISAYLYLWSPSKAVGFAPGSLAQPPSSVLFLASIEPSSRRWLDPSRSTLVYWPYPALPSSLGPNRSYPREPGPTRRHPMESGPNRVVIRLIHQIF